MTYEHPISLQAVSPRVQQSSFNDVTSDQSKLASSNLTQNVPQSSKKFVSNS